MENINNEIVSQDDLDLLNKLSSAFKEQKEKLQIREAVRGKIASSTYINIKPAAKMLSKVLLYGIPTIVIISSVAIFSFFKFDFKNVYKSNINTNNIGIRQNQSTSVNANLGNNVTVNKFSGTDKTAIKNNLTPNRKTLKHHKSKRVVVAGINPNKNQKSTITKIRKTRKRNTPIGEK
jgi:hypothetical protein